MTAPLSTPIGALLRAGEVFTPDGDEARRWAEEELSKPAYRAAEPTWFDRLAADVVKWIADLFSADGAGAIAPAALTVIVIIVIAAIVVALFIWGRPRASRTERRYGRLLGERDDRTAAQLRAEAQRRAKQGDWDGALVLRFRAVARALLERDLIDPAPGATAQGIAREATGPFPGFAQRLHEAATSFDAVRYLNAPATEDGYRAMASLDDSLRSAAPLLPATTAVPA